MLPSVRDFMLRYQECLNGNAWWIWSLKGGTVRIIYAYVWHWVETSRACSCPRPCSSRRCVSVVWMEELGLCWLLALVVQVLEVMCYRPWVRRHLLAHQQNRNWLRKFFAKFKFQQFVNKKPCGSNYSWDYSQSFSCCLRYNHSILPTITEKKCMIDTLCFFPMCN